MQGGGSDLVFPHHEMSAGHAQVAHPGERFARTYAHAGMVAYDGEKMSKSKGNLVFVSALRMSEVDPMAIRLVLLRHHYRSDWEWTDDQLWDAVDTLATWRRALALGNGAPALPYVERVLAALADDLDAPTAVDAVQEWVEATLGTDRPRRHLRPGRRGDRPPAPRRRARPLALTYAPPRRPAVREAGSWAAEGGSLTAARRVGVRRADARDPQSVSRRLR